MNPDNLTDLLRDWIARHSTGPNLIQIADASDLTMGHLRRALALAEQQQAEIERLTEQAQSILGAASNVGLYDGDDPDDALDCLTSEIDGYTKMMWRIMRCLNSGSARPDEIEAAIKEMRERVAKLEREKELLSESALELAELLRAHWKTPAESDAITLYCASLLAGFAKAWKQNPPDNGFLHCLNFAEGLGRLEIQIRKIEGKSAVESILEMKAERDAAIAEVARLQAALREIQWQASKDMGTWLIADLATAALSDAAAAAWLLCPTCGEDGLQPHLKPPADLTTAPAKDAAPTHRIYRDESTSEARAIWADVEKAASRDTPHAPTEAADLGRPEEPSDSEMLDWIERQGGCDVYRINSTQVVVDPPSPQAPAHAAPTMRDAIRAAMKQERS